MKKGYILAAAACVFATLGVSAASALKTAYKFADNSPIAEGRWVKISIPETGVYEISYDKLREMGFADPTKVSVFGHGGSNIDINFQNTKGVRLYEDVPKQFGVVHSNDKLVFYAIGPEMIVVDATNSKVRFTRSARNIYTDISYYYLSDTADVLEVPVSHFGIQDTALERNDGYGYIYHEIDAVQGSGQIFWGETLNDGTPLEFDRLSYPYAASGAGYIVASFAIGKNSNGKMTTSFNDFKRVNAINNITADVKTLQIDDSGLKFDIDGNGHGNARLSFTTSDASDASTVALDYFTVSCPMDLSLMAADGSLSQQYVAFPNVANSGWKMRIPRGSMVWDVSDPANIKGLENDDNFAYHNTASVIETVVFNPSQTLKQIDEDWSVIPNQNLHGLQKEGYDLLIVSTQDMLDYANTIARLHEEHDGIKVLVTTIEQVYNEFNIGSPDPMATRALVKMLYHNSAKPLKNVLFIGSMTGDLRNIRGVVSNPDSHIAYQQITKNFASHCFTVMDYYGCVTDNILFPDDLRNVPVNVGVGVLPITTDEEGANVVSKIREYLEKDDFSNVANETFAMSCDGDTYTHDSQSAVHAETMKEVMGANFNSGFSHHQIRYDGLDKSSRRQQFIDAINRGKLYGLYYGHALISGLGPNGDVSLGSNDLLTLDNKELSFYFVAGCDLFNPAQSIQGFGDIGVTRAKRGFFATVCAMGQVMSNENEKLVKSFYNALFFDRTGALRTTPVTLGEALAQAKHVENNSSELAYMLVGDPALRLAMPLGKVELSVDGSDFLPGEYARVTGRVLNAEGATDNTYNGYVTVKLMEPARTIVLPKQMVDENNNVVGNYKSDMTDFRLSAVRGEVYNGQFSVNLPIPANSDAYLSTPGSTVKLPVYAATYNPKTHLAASAKSELKMGLTGGASSPDALKDVTAPDIVISYDDQLQMMKVEAYDDVALTPGVGNGAGVTFAVNGDHFTLASDESDNLATTFYNTNISMAHLPEGNYTARAKATDLAGNSSEWTEVVFNISKTTPLQLTAMTEPAIDDIDFAITGNFSGTLQLIITDLEGNTVYKSDVDSKKFGCDISSLESGIYRAAVRDDSARGARVYSNWVEFTVID